MTQGFPEASSIKAYWQPGCTSCLRMKEFLAKHGVVFVSVNVLEDKDAVGMLGPLLGACERAWFTAPPSSRALSPAALQSLARQRGFERVACTSRPAQALAGAQRWAQEHDAAVLATGSVYLVGDLLAGMQAGLHAGASPARLDARASAPPGGASR